MSAKNFEFDNFDDDAPYDPVPESVEKNVTVESLLTLKFGKIRGRAIYRELARVANRAAQENGGLPGLIFNQAGGEFVSFHPNDDFDPGEP
ncbi:hypothetical protein EBZ39_00545 [bacterium]|nr:hypothetical protein [bacterium]